MYKEKQIYEKICFKTKIGILEIITIIIIILKGKILGQFNNRVLILKNIKILR